MRNRLFALLAAGLALWPVATALAGEPFGTLLGTSYETPAYSNSTPGYISNIDNYYSGVYTGMKWQCVEYARRWLMVNDGAKFGPVDYAVDIWDLSHSVRLSDGASIPMKTYGNGGTDAPQPGDLLIFNTNYYSPTGHVAVIVGVNRSAGYVKVAEQNNDNAYWPGSYARQLSMTVSNGHYTVYSSTKVNGWKRVSRICQYVSQSTAATWVKPGQPVSCWVKYKNLGAAPWKRSTDLDYLTSTELQSCDSDGSIVASWLDPVGWIDSGRIRVVPIDQTTINYNQTAQFSFNATIPTSATTGLKQIYFRPVGGGRVMDDNWAGMYFPFNVDASLPDAFTVSANPTTNSVNSFSFSWTASADAVSGLKGYYYSVNGGSESTLIPPGTTSVPVSNYATQQGDNTFTVRAEDNAGNSRSASVTFKLTSSPCPGREISHDPCRQPGDPCLPAQTANLQTLPDLTPEQWTDVGQPVSAVLKANVQYSVGFEYRAAATTDIKLELGGFAHTAALGRVVATATLAPSTTRDWRTFWSAPFTLTAEQLKTGTNLRVSLPTSGFEIRNVKVAAYH